MTKSHRNGLASIVYNSLKYYNWSRFNPKHMDKKRLYIALKSMLRPIANYTDIKYENGGSLMIANIICFMMFVVSAVEFAFTAFPFNYNDPDHFNIGITLLSSSALLLLWSVANWGICSLLDGEGTFREVWIVTCYAMLPRVIFSIPLVIISNALTLNEQGLYSMVSAVLLTWCGILLVLGMMVVHQYTVSKTIASVFLSIAGIAIVLFIAMLFFSMGQQFVSFIDTVISEVRYRV